MQIACDCAHDQKCESWGILHMVIKLMVFVGEIPVVRNLVFPLGLQQSCLNVGIQRPLGCFTFALEYTGNNTTTTHT